MKTISQTLIALSIGLATSVLAQEPPQEMQGGMMSMMDSDMPMERMQENVEQMRSQLDRAQSAEDDEERQQALQDYMKTMRENMGMAKQVMPDDMMGATNTKTPMERMQENVERMCSQLDKAESDEERQLALQDHMQTMRENMGMTRQMMPMGMMGSGMMMGGGHGQGGPGMGSPGMMMGGGHGSGCGQGGPGMGGPGMMPYGYPDQDMRGSKTSNCPAR